MATRKIPFVLLGASFLFLLGCCSFSHAQGTSGSQGTSGLKFNNLNISPFVNLEYRYDSNVGYGQKSNGDSVFTVSPGVDLNYTGNDWGLSGKAWYGYDKYDKYDDLDQSRYGESLHFYAESARGLRFLLGQNYIKTHQDDSILDGGNGIWRERDLHEILSALSYQISERSSLTLNGMFSDLNYHNDRQAAGDKYGKLYGWREWSIGLEAARKLTEKSNFLLSGSHQQYDSAGNRLNDDNGASKIDSNSKGYTVMAGFGSRATERISYHALTGVSWFDYANSDQLVGWVYSLDANWVITKKWAWSIAGSSYFQPSERDAQQAMKVYALSTGLTYRPMKRLSTRFDIGVRREENEDGIDNRGAVARDKFSARLRADYMLQKYVSIYGAVSYEEQLSDDKFEEFDRFQGVLGLHFRY